MQYKKRRSGIFTLHPTVVNQLPAMNDEVLTRQLARTDNLMGLLNDEAFVRSTAAIETECGGAVEAGLGLRSYVAQIEARRLKPKYTT